MSLKEVQKIAKNSSPENNNEYYSGINEFFSGIRGENRFIAPNLPAKLTQQGFRRLEGTTTKNFRQGVPSCYHTHYGFMPYGWLRHLSLRS
ncbi:hypothetical protein LC653_29930 [Nostoc sp. CHAB 5784]|uniref:hypothetical protein n=1 Tax=Nostoc mirabile TaxID=2907820 RepID=UPI001E3586A5|nr:hypothetical protein [Nostoc mirabile]MCC5667979.1 hypothetical protein [Nostoc mirabile CHAB5784]